MLTKNIQFKNFKFSASNKKIKKDLKKLLEKKSELIKSLTPFYNYSYSKKIFSKFKKKLSMRIIGMGGSILGTKAIYDFLRYKIKNEVTFIDNLQTYLEDDKKKINIIVSKSGNTLETITNTNLLIKDGQKNIFIIENNNNYLRTYAQKLKAEIINHNNFIGGRYSVLSEVGMLPAELMGLNEKKFKQLNNLIKNENFVNLLITSVNNTLYFLKKKRFNSIILNYDKTAESLFKWYQQLIAESLGKKSKGIFPIVSSMPKDNHSLMQLYLDGPKNNFFTFFSVKEKNTPKIMNNKILSSYSYLKNKDLNQIIFSQKLATEKVFLKKNIPFRSFEILNKDEKTLGELFCFFILETILLGRALRINPFDQPSVELIKKETKKILI
jgi:glucose-6-phosphate isomerase